MLGKLTHFGCKNTQNGYLSASPVNKNYEQRILISWKSTREKGKKFLVVCMHTSSFNSVFLVKQTHFQCNMIHNGHMSASRKKAGLTSAPTFLDSIYGMPRCLQVKRLGKFSSWPVSDVVCGWSTETTWWAVERFSGHFESKLCVLSMALTQALTKGEIQRVRVQRNRVVNVSVNSSIKHNPRCLRKILWMIQVHRPPIWSYRLVEELHRCGKNWILGWKTLETYWHLNLIGIFMEVRQCFLALLSRSQKSH